jgi:serine/threonine-protein kinase
MSDLAEVLGSALTGRYVIERELGRGAMATVFLARDVKHDRRVAIKVLDPVLGSELQGERFLREIRIVAGLSHPNIVPVHDSGEADGLLYAVMPYIEGESLADRLRREKQLPLADALALARDVAEALAYAHAQGVVHRDVKPSNILLSSGRALVADFGVARAVRAAGSEKLTRTGMAVGTPVYMSPEQIAGETEIDGRSDVYALGCVLYEMLAGQPPFTGPTGQSLMAQHIAATPPDVTTLRGSVPSGVSGALSKALAKVPADRWSTAADFALALSTDATRASAEIPRARRRPGRWTVVTVAGVLVATAVAGLWARAGARLSRAAGNVAVIPFAPASPDTALSRLGRELAVTLSLNLDGVGSFQVIHPLSVLSRASDDQPYTVEDAMDLGARLGASSVIYGTLVAAGSDVRVDLGLYETDDVEPLATATVSASANDITALTDSVTWSLLRRVWRSGPPPSPSVAAITTRSIPALRAFLEGERHVAAGAFRNAATAYGRAIEADSTFWFAYWRYAWSLSWHGQPIDSAVRAAYTTRRDHFPEPDRMLIEVNLTQNSLSGRIEALRQITARHPDYWPAWISYQDQLVHAGGLVGYGYADSRAALEQLTALHPDLIPGWTHYMWIAAHMRDSVASGRALAELTRLRYDSTSLADDGLNSLDLYRFIDLLVRGGGRPDSALIAAGVAMLSSYRGSIPVETFPGELTKFGFALAEIDFARAILESAEAPLPLKQGALRSAAFSMAQRGAWDSALVVAAEAANAMRLPVDELRGYRAAVIAEWLGASAAPATDAWRRRAEAVRSALPPFGGADFDWLDGIVAVARGDSAGLAAAQGRLAASPALAAQLLARSLAAFAVHLAGRPSEAGRLLMDLELGTAEAGRARITGRQHPFFTPVNRLAAARALLEAGDAAEASRLLRWFEPVLTGPEGETELAFRSFEGPAWLERGRAAEALGQVDEARLAYRRVLERYDRPVPALQWIVDSARQALARLGT